MEKMDMAWCSIRPNLILPLSPSPSVSSTPPAHTGLPSRRWGWQTAGLLQSDFASHCMSAFCTRRQPHNECHMSNNASLPLTYGNSIMYDNGFIVFLCYRVGCIIHEKSCPDFISNCWRHFDERIFSHFPSFVLSNTRRHYRDTSHMCQWCQKNVKLNEKLCLCTPGPQTLYKSLLKN